VLALLFPGQGSQEVGMGRDAFEASAAARAVFDEADAALGLPLSRICFEGPEDELRRTEIQQPALLTTSIALLRGYEEAAGEIAADYFGGHSLGEYSALVASGALAFEDAVRLVHARGRFMQEAVAEGRGAMAAVMGCGPEVVREACEQAAADRGEVVAPANYNSPQQTVIAGEAGAVEAAGALARERGAKRVVALPVSAPFHCALMSPAAAKLRPELDRVAFRAPRRPVVTNVEAAPNEDPERIPDLLEQQVTAPVRFTEMVECLQGLGVTSFLEVGAGRVLSGLLARIDRRAQRGNLSSWADVDEVRAFLAG
jgi:[acyl-carrier-protein] S-malonyltransferase